MHRFAELSRRGGHGLLLLGLLALLQIGLVAQTGSANAAAPKTTLDAVSEKLTCRCGCNLVLNRCNHVQCSSAIPMRERIVREIAEGKSRDEIIAGFVRDMGEEVLAVPPASGFNLNAWIMPFAGLLVGAILVVVALRIMLRKRPIEAIAAATSGAAGALKSPDEMGKEKDERIEKELKEFGDL